MVDRNIGTAKASDMENVLEDYSVDARATNGTITHTHKNVEYTFKELEATTAFSVAQYLIEVSAPVVGNLFDASQVVQDEFSDGETSFGLDLGLILSKQLHLIDIQAWSPVLIPELTRNGVRIELKDLTGKGSLAVLISLIEASLKENVLDFLAEWLAEKGLKIPSLKQAQVN